VIATHWQHNLMLGIPLLDIELLSHSHKMTIQVKLRKSWERRTEASH